MIQAYVTLPRLQIKISPTWSKTWTAPIDSKVFTVASLVISSWQPIEWVHGQDQTWSWARASFWQLGLKDDVSAHTGRCEACGINKGTKKPGWALLHHADVPGTNLFYVTLPSVRKAIILYSPNSRYLNPPEAGGLFQTLGCGAGVFSDTVNHSKSVKNDFTVK